MNKIIKAVAAVAIMVVCFYAGLKTEHSSAARMNYWNTCDSFGGKFLNTEHGCEFEGQYKVSVKNDLNRACESGKGFYLYNDSNTKWFHKCA